MSEKDDILIEEEREMEPKPGSDRGTADTLGEKRRLSEPLSPPDANRRLFLHSLAGFLTAGVAGWTGFLGWRWMSDETKQRLLSGTLELNERVAQTLYSPTRLAPEFPNRPVTMRVNGDIGLAAEFDTNTWRLAVGDLRLTLDDIRSLPRTEMVVEFKCIEGWSTITHFAGTRFSDFATKYGPASLPPYVALATPDEGYFVGWDTPAIMHPQTLLAYEMNGAPLKPEHGAPLRLASPTKYGIKQIKRIGRIEFTAERPRDYWAEQGYDWYSGL